MAVSGVKRCVDRPNALKVTPSSSILPAPRYQACHGEEMPPALTKQSVIYGIAMSFHSRDDIFPKLKT